MAVKLRLDYDPAFLYRVFQAGHIDTPCIDVDQILLDRDYLPRALIETTSCDPKQGCRNPRFLAALDRRMSRAPQGKYAQRIANGFRVPAFWVVFTPPPPPPKQLALFEVEGGFEDFAIRRLDEPGKWWFADQKGYIDWAHSLTAEDDPG